ncbi:hypothetical protein OAC41_04600 [Acidimicrobiales bacterium]|nr:hypothetical protein [Acidimicrobiales bacterium]
MALKPRWRARERTHFVAIADIPRQWSAHHFRRRDLDLDKWLVRERSRNASA